MLLHLRSRGPRSPGVLPPEDSGEKLVAVKKIAAARRLVAEYEEAGLVVELRRKSR